jgi:hypothetical protein
VVLNYVGAPLTDESHWSPVRCVETAGGRLVPPFEDAETLNVLPHKKSGRGKILQPRPELSRRGRTTRGYAPSGQCYHHQRAKLTFDECVSEIVRIAIQEDDAVELSLAVADAYLASFVGLRVALAAPCWTAVAGRVTSPGRFPAAGRELRL